MPAEVSLFTDIIKNPPKSLGKNPYPAFKLPKTLYHQTVDLTPHPQPLSQAIVDSFQTKSASVSAIQSYQELSTKYGVERVRQELRIQAIQNPFMHAIFQHIEEILRLSPQREHHPRLEEIYNQISSPFSKYEPNTQLNGFDGQWLSSLFKGSTQILDIGCGTGRLLQSLQAEGLNVVGIDLVQKHIAEVNTQVPDAKIALSSWHNLPFKDGSFANAYCLGRSITHNTTVEDYIKFFKEARRVLQTNGQLVIDMPDINTGHHAEVTKLFKEKMAANGIYAVEEGSLHDSPDGEHFFDRLILPQEQFTAIARFCGFEAQIITKQNYTDSQKTPNTNLYWILRKLPEPATLEEVIENLSQIVHAREKLYSSNHELKEYYSYSSLSRN